MLRPRGFPIAEVSHEQPRFSVPDAARSRQRATVAALEREISRLPRQAADDDRSASSGLLVSIADLVEQLALGPEPDVRECPHCKHIGMRAAMHCGYCWTRLTRPTGVDGGG